VPWLSKRAGNQGGNANPEQARFQPDEPATDGSPLKPRHRQPQACSTKDRTAPPKRAEAPEGRPVARRPWNTAPESKVPSRRPRRIGHVNRSPTLRLTDSAIGIGQNHVSCENQEFMAKTAGQRLPRPPTSRTARWVGPPPERHGDQGLERRLSRALQNCLRRARRAAAARPVAGLGRRPETIP